jgi:hypothetical protein
MQGLGVKVKNMRPLCALSLHQADFDVEYLLPRMAEISKFAMIVAYNEGHFV